MISYFIYEIQQCDSSTVTEIFVRFSPELEYMFPLLIAVCYLTHGLAEADGYLSMIWNSVAGTLAIFIETQTSFS